MALENTADITAAIKCLSPIDRTPVSHDAIVRTAPWGHGLDIFLPSLGPRTRINITTDYNNGNSYDLAKPKDAEAALKLCEDVFAKVSGIPLKLNNSNKLFCK